ncbi:hypothetical protein CKK33_15265 [Mucilaginibacter sp. MD40]|uniref:lactate dehydrogenase n=1 Tax=Mucilaginibacter sp. MD40 TaxID=2029590 RepID=UPI000BACE9FF|nr:lactate dehydrogenase [Mucilaginibacter sp. MD40]PAW94780.1 hypothetical protein CKK33_15265 [Mucilaginibacter sp. MD40]
MKVVAYSIKPFEKEYLSKANQKKHDITLISNPLSEETTIFAEGKDAVLVFTGDDVSEKVIGKLNSLGVKYIATRSADTSHIDVAATGRYGIKVANVPDAEYANPAIELQAIADQTIKNLDLWQLNKCVGNACACAKNCRAIPSPNIHPHESATSSEI